MNTPNPSSPDRGELIQTVAQIMTDRASESDLREEYLEACLLQLTEWTDAQLINLIKDFS